MNNKIDLCYEKESHLVLPPNQHFTVSKDDKKDTEECTVDIVLQYAPRHLK